MSSLNPVNSGTNKFQNNINQTPNDLIVTLTEANDVATPIIQNRRGTHTARNASAVMLDPSKFCLDPSELEGKRVLGHLRILSNCNDFQIPYDVTPTSYSAFDTPRNQPTFFGNQQTIHNRGVSQAIHQMIDETDDESEISFYLTKFNSDKEIGQDEAFYWGEKCLKDEKYHEAAQIFYRAKHNSIKFKTKSEEHFNTICKKAEQDQKAAFGLAQLYKGLGECKVALEYCLKAQDEAGAKTLLVDLLKSDKELWQDKVFHWGEKFLIDEEYHEAAQIFHIAQQKSYLHKNKAKVHFATICEEAEQTPKAAFGLAQFFKELGEYDLAIEYCKIAQDVEEAKLLLESLTKRNWV